MDLSELGKQPISPDAPGGEDAKYEPEYEEIENEMAKLTSPSASGAVNWENVKTLSHKILAEKSKDMLCASYLVVGLLRTEGMKGFSAGLDFYKDMVENFWDNLKPPKKRMRGRKNALEWMYGQGEAYLRNNEIPPQPEEEMNRIMESFDALNGFLSENMEDPPYHRDFMEALNMVPVEAKEAPEETPQPDKASPATTTPPPPPPSAPAAAPDVPDQMASDQDATKTMNAGLKLLKQVATYYLENDAQNHKAYLFNRMAAWIPVNDLPPNTERVTKIPAPPEQIRSVLENLYTSGDWENLLTAAESKISQFLFWFDLSRWVYEALEHLGGPYEKARDTVGRETAAFVSRLAGIENLAFADETPFADPETKAWLEDMIRAGDDDKKSSAEAEGAEEAQVEQEFDKARQTAKEKDLPAAVEMLQERLRASGSYKARLLRRMALARLLILSKKNVPAKPHLEEILNEIQRFHLAEWDPELALEGYKVVLSGIRSNKDQESVQKTRQVLDSIARISPGEALRLEG